MTKRYYYYDDPLAAMWMCFKFGMKIHTEHGSLMDYDDLLERASEIDEDCGDKLYIHPESEHLLQVREGDLVDDDWEPYIAESNEDHIGMGRIASRNEIPFHWPKGEYAK